MREPNPLKEEEGKASFHVHSRHSFWSFEWIRDGFFADYSLVVLFEGING